MATRVLIGQADTAFAWLKPKFLSLEKFKLYRESIEGARFDRETKRNLAPIDKIPNILRRLRNAGIAVELEAELRDTLQRFTAQQWNDLKAAQERIVKMDDAFFELTGNRLYPFQRSGSQWLATRHGALLADEMGLGKTLQAIAALPAGVPAVVVAPAVAKGVWLREFAKYRPHKKVVVLKGRDSFRWPEDDEVIVTNYDILPENHDKKRCNGFLPRERCPGCKPEFSEGGVRIKGVGHQSGCDGFLDAMRCPGCAPFLDLCPPQCVLIADEAHNLKNSKAQRTLRFRSLSDRTRRNDGRTWLITATPLLNNPQELWAVYQAAGIASEAFGDWKSFVVLFKGKSIYWGGYEWGTPEAEVAERIRRVALRRMRLEVLPQLPAKTWSEITVDIKDKATLRECDKLVKGFGGAAAFEEMVSKDTLKFEQISSVRAALATAKIPPMLELLEDFDSQEEPVVVFSAHRAPIDLLARRKGWRVITGDTPPHIRTEIENQFQAGELRGIGCTIKAGGVAITLTKAHIAIFVDQEWTPALNAQAEDRICRIGQSRGCIIYILKANHILDERLAELLTRKQRIITASVDASSSKDDVPDAHYEEQIHAIQAEIAQGRAVRRMAEAIEEQDALLKLNTFVFRSEREQRLVVRLAEEAELIGLSNAQWSLVLRIVDQGVEPGLGDVNVPKKKTRKKKAGKDDAAA